jgi:hypothetical protein
MGFGMNVGPILSRFEEMVVSDWKESKSKKRRRCWMTTSSSSGLAIPRKGTSEIWSRRRCTKLDTLFCMLRFLPVSLYHKASSDELMEKADKAFFSLPLALGLVREAYPNDSEKCSAVLCSSTLPTVQLAG